MRYRVPTNQYDQKSFLARIEKNYLQKAKAAGQTRVEIGIPMLERLLEVANHARRLNVGRPRKAPKITLEVAVQELKWEIAKLFTQGRKANPPKLPTGDQIGEVIKRKAKETGYSESYLEDMLQHPGRLRHPRKGRSKKKTNSAD
jgi:hypothetical protein